MKFKFILVLILVTILATSCYKRNVPPVSISFLSQVQTSYGSTAEPGEIYIDYIIYNNTMYKINYCEVQFVVYYEDGTFEITEPDVTTGIRNDQRNNLYIDTDKEMKFVDVHSIFINGSGCRYNIIGR